ncbi:E3 ubiquitin-protein ligase UBR3 isoform X3 [Lepeophtheirus salmonis]|uniref:E3 ubiquitin-protein ligase UBR3 isoform X3 n=1 Tax=Lepeophtheirus salmonis TaxID=72036 RepID=UPI003AF3E3EB
MRKAEVLMRKGKRTVAALILAECVSCSSAASLSVLLDHLLCPETDLSDAECLDWCRWLVGGGETFEAFSRRVRRFDYTEKCGLVWTADFVAFRCRTCGISQCMSLCAECFQEGNHEGHDFNMFKSQAGGACDCGDASVMRPEGFCSKHRQPPDSASPSPPEELLLVASLLMPRVILRLVQHLRVNAVASSTCPPLSPKETLARYERTIQTAEGLLVLLHDFSSLGAAMRVVMTHSLIDPQLYSSLTSINSDSENVNFMRKSQNLYEDAIEDLPNIASDIPIEHKGMNVNERELDAHIEFEPSTYYASFSAELEASASPMWALISHLKNKETGQYTANVIKHCVVALMEWFKVNNFTSPNQCNIFKVSFHIPLHRYFSMFVRQGVICHGFSLKELLPEPEILSLVMAHPLRVQTAFYEIMCGIWVRNGLQIKGQAMTYLQCHFCKSMVDADIFLLQVCATQLPPLHFLSTVLERFQMDDWLTFSSANKNNRVRIDREQVIPMIESCLTFIVSLLVLRSNLGLSETDLARLEMVTLLCMGDKQHSKLFDSIPEKSANPIHIELFDKVLLEVGQYREPQFEAGGNMQQGIYLPKPNVWDNLYDPIYVLLRAVHRRDFQTSIDRFNEYAKNKYSNDPERLKTINNLWPPWRLPSPCHKGFDDPRRLLHSRFFHGLIFNILYKAVHDEEVMVSEHVISLTIFLLELALTYPQDGYSGREIAISKPWLIVHKPTDLKYDTWFPTDWLSANLRHVVSALFIPPITGDLNDPSKSNSIVPTNFQDIMPSMQMEVDNIDSLNSSASSTSGSNFFTSPSPFIMPKNALTYFYSTCSMTLDNRGVVMSNTKEHSKIPFANKNKYSVSLQGQGENYLSTSCQSVIGINESIITLLLKLHSKLSKIPDSYIPIHNRTGVSTTSSYRGSRIGNGCFFIEKVLDLIVEFDEMCKQSVSASRTQIWPSYHNDEAVKEQSFERKEAEIRRKRAKQRQKQMMEELVAQQRRFMANVNRGNENISLFDAESGSKMPSNNTSISNQFCSTFSSNEKREVYDCVHCHLTTVSTEEKPIGLVVLLQATSVLSHMHYESSKLILPTCDEEQYLLNTHSLGIEYENQFQELSRHFSSDSYLLAQTRGWAGGIHIQSCGHRVHLSCRQSYMEHLRSQQRSENNHVLDVEHGEYMCPMCRQLANSILPIPPNIDESSSSFNSPSSEEELTKLAEQILFLSNEKSIFEDNRFDTSSCSRGASSMTPLKRAMSQLMEQLPKATLLQYQPSSSNRSAHVIFVFVSSIARINLELDLVQRGGTLIGKNNEVQSPSTGVNPFKTCFVPLLHVLSNHVKTTCPIDLSREWIGITGLESTLNSSPNYSKTVPLLLQDCTTLFLHFLLMLPIQLDIVLFETLTKAHFNLQLIQSMARTSCAITDVEREHMRFYSLKSCVPSTFPEYLGRIVEYLGTSSLYNKLNKIINKIVDIESHVQRLTLPFLRIVSVVRHYLYSEPLPEIDHLNDEFAILVKFLHLNNYTRNNSTTPSIKCLNWFSKKNTRIHVWFKEFESFSIKSTTSSFRLLCKNTLWAQPQLLQLPKNYDAIFQFYHKKECGVCHQVPKDPSICLLCGVLVCFKESCCRFGGNSNNGMCEAIRHSFDCGAGTAMFLAVNSSYIVVVRGRRACVWGSIYLDSFGEEDKELKRGRPLFLNDERYNLLQQQWINHRFSHNNRTWIWHWNQL